jgi:hypothetical protein
VECSRQKTLRVWVTSQFVINVSSLFFRNNLPQRKAISQLASNAGRSIEASVFAGLRLMISFVLQADQSERLTYRERALLYHPLICINRATECQF